MKKTICLMLALLIAALGLLTGCSVKESGQPAATTPAITTAQTIDAAATELASALAQTDAATTASAAATTAAGDPHFGPAPAGYFEETLFIGDSRTEDLLNYDVMTTPTIFSRVSTSIYNLYKEPAKVNNGIGEIDFEDLIEEHQFKHIYIMLGFNEVGYPQQQTANKIGELVEELREKQPDADIILEANLHVTAAYAARHPDESNENIDALNEKIAALADNEKVFYIDMNEIFDDANGNLDEQYTGDGCHLTPQATQKWADWLATKAVV